MLIKVKFAPDDKELKDIGTMYIIADDVRFINSLKEMKHYKTMTEYLDAHKEYYYELTKVPNEYDLEFNVSHTMIDLVENSDISIEEKFRYKRNNDDTYKL